MDLTFSAEEAAFRDELRGWLDEHSAASPPTTEEGVFAWRRAWQRRLFDGGWAAVHWPTEYGGRGASLTQSAIFFEELARAGEPLPANALGILLAGPTIMVWGTPDQKERYLQPILSADEIWCQGFSEPDAGSDLASAQDPCGQATGTIGWSPGRRSGRPTRSTQSGACCSPVRTSRRAKHKGLSYFLMDMEQDGVTVRPLRQITGEAHFNELFHRRCRGSRTRIFWAASGQRLEGRADHPDERARRAWGFSSRWSCAVSSTADRGAAQPRAPRGSVRRRATW